MKTKNIILLILFIEMQVLLVFTWLNYNKVNDLDTKVRNTNIFLHELYQDKGVRLLDNIDEYDIVLGNPNAPKSIVMYSKDNCSACTDFETNVFPKINEAFIKTGEVKFILRKLYSPEDEKAAFINKHAYYLSKEGKGIYDNEIISFFWDETKDTSKVSHQTRKIFAEDNNLSKYLADDEILHNFNNNIQKARENGIRGTPTFIVNGKKLVGSRKFSKFEELLAQ